MSEQSTQVTSELFDTETPEAMSAQTDSSEEAKKEEVFNHETAEMQRNKQIETWSKRVINGEADLNDLPKAQAWLKPHIEAKLKPNINEIDVESIVNKKLQEATENQKFTNLKAKVNELPLTAGQRSELELEYKDLVQAGLSKAKALEKAIKLVRADDTVSNEVKYNMALPRTETKSTQKDVSEDNLFKLDVKSRMAYYQQLENSN